MLTPSELSKLKLAETHLKPSPRLKAKFLDISSSPSSPDYEYKLSAKLTRNYQNEIRCYSKNTPDKKSPKKIRGFDKDCLHMAGTPHGPSIPDLVLLL